jgi:hypothetical protein
VNTKFPGTAEPTIATRVRREAEPERVDFHFPVEIHLEQPEQPVDLDTVAQRVFDRLARRLT